MTTQTQRPTEAAPVPERASWGRVIRDQRKTELVALGLMIFSLWFRQLGTWSLPIALAAGILLGLVNHLVTEYWLLRVITSGGQPTRGQITRATIIRLAVLAAVAVVVAVVLWPDGIGVLLGLAIFRLIALVMTTIPLLKELKQQ
jgi:hypothetical protein